MKINCVGSYIEPEHPVTLKTGDKIRLRAGTAFGGEHVDLDLQSEGEHVATVHFSPLRAFQLGKLLINAAIEADR